MKFQIEAKATRKYYITFEAKNAKMARVVEEILEEHCADHEIDTFDVEERAENPNSVLFLTEVGTVKIKANHGYINQIGEPVSMEPEDIEIRDEVESWDGNLNTFEIYDKLRNEFGESDQKKLINYAKKYFYNCKDLQYQLQDMADTLMVDLDEDEDEDE
ncbi:MAG: hypothetical protein VW879_06365 [Opitutae bacterium]